MNNTNITPYSFKKIKKRIYDISYKKKKKFKNNSKNKTKKNSNSYSSKKKHQK